MKKHKPEEIRQILAAYRDSSLTVAEFCRQHSICKATLYRWGKLYPPKESDFQELVPDDTPILEAGKSSQPFCRLQLPGTTLDFYQEPDPEFLKKLICPC